MECPGSYRIMRDLSPNHRLLVTDECRILNNLNLDPKIASDLNILIPCGVHLQKSGNVMIEVVETEECICGNRIPTKVITNSIEHQIITLCTNEIYTIIYNENGGKCECGKQLFDIEPAEGYGGNGWCISSKKCLKCTSVNEIIGVLFENGFQRDEIYFRPTNQVKLNSFNMIPTLKLEDEWQRDLTAENVESNPGPIMLTGDRSYFNAANTFIWFSFKQDIPFYPWYDDLKSPIAVLNDYIPTEKRNYTTWKQKGFCYSTKFNIAIGQTKDKYVCIRKSNSGQWFTYMEDKIIVGKPTDFIPSVKGWIRDLTAECIESNPGPNYISLLNEHAQKNRNQFPNYSFEMIIMNDEILFTCTCKYIHVIETSNPHRTKKEAKNEAAELVVRIIE